MESAKVKKDSVHVELIMIVNMEHLTYILILLQDNSSFVWLIWNLLFPMPNIVLRQTPCSQMIQFEQKTKHFD